MGTASITSQDAGAIIDSALLGASQGLPLDQSVPPGESGLEPGPLPTDEPAINEENLTEEQKQARKDQEKIAKAQEDMLGKEQAEALAEEERKRLEREQTLLGLADKALQASKGAASGVGVKIASAPTPGSITFPLVLLILFFFALIVYAGRTRLQWIGLVLTNNAYVTAQEQGTSTGGGPPNPAQETPAEVYTLPATGNGMYGSMYS